MMAGALVGEALAEVVFIGGALVGETFASVVDG